MGTQRTGVGHDDDVSLIVGNVELDIRRFRTLVDGVDVPLTYQEFELLRLLAMQRDRILSYTELIGGLWGTPSAGARRRLGVVVCRLRAKLSRLEHYHIQTVRGRGYGLTLM